VPVALRNDYGHTSVECLLPPGEGADLPVYLLTTAKNTGQGGAVRVVANASSADTGLFFSYEPPFLESVQPNRDGPTGGGTLLTLTGRNLGVRGEVFVGPSRCELPAPEVRPWAGNGHNKLYCLLPPGTGTQNVRTLVGGQWSNGRDYVYAPPALLSLSPDTGHAGGLYPLRISGTDLGADPSAVQVLFGAPPSASRCEISVADHTSLECVTPPGVGGRVPVIVAVGGQLADTTLYFSYLPPAVQSVSGCPRDLPSNPNATADCPTISSSLRLTITGTGFGNNETFNGQGMSVTVDGLPCANPALAPSPSPPLPPSPTFGPVGAVTCLLPINPSGGLNLPVVVTVPSPGTSSASADTAGLPQSSAPQPLVSYQGPRLLPGTLRLQGGVPSGRVTVASTGSVAVLEMDGVHLGDDAADVTVRYGTAGQPALFGCSLVSLAPLVSLEADLGASPDPPVQTLTCRLEGSGVGVDLRFTVQVGPQTSPPGEDGLSYALPVLTDRTLRLPGGPKGFSRLVGTATEGQRVVFNGKNFGNRPDLLQVLYGRYSHDSGSSTSSSVQNHTITAEGPEYMCGVDAAASSDSEIVCRTAEGEGGPYNFRVLVPSSSSSASSQPAAFATSLPGNDSYSYPVAPVVVSVSGCPASFKAEGNASDLVGTAGCPSEGGIRLTISGKHFTADNTSTAVRVGSQLCDLMSFDQVASSSSSSSSSDASTTDIITCRLPEGTGLLRDVVVKVGFLFSRANPLVSYLAPSLSSIQGCPVTFPDPPSTSECPRDSGVFPTPAVILTLGGANFGPGTGGDTLVLIGGSPCKNVRHSASSPHRELTCTLPSGSGADLDVLVIAGQAPNNSASLSYVPCTPGSSTAASPLNSSSTSSNGGAEDRCQPCSPGTTSASPGAQECLPCPPGYFAGSAGLSSCSRCPVGTSSSPSSPPLNGSTSTPSSASGASSCSVCGSGRFASQPGAAECELCPVGRSRVHPFQPDASACVPCAPGFASPSTGSSSCSPCARGRFSVVSGQTQCTPCPLGTSSLEGSTSCATCTAGFYQPGEGGAPTLTGGGNLSDPSEEACFPCAAGTSSTVGAATCSPCVAGTFTDGTGMSSCVRCDPGLFAAESGSSNCSACAPGTYAEEPGSISCRPCGKGTFALSPGTALCPPCPPGTSSDTEGATLCAPCPPGSSALEPGGEACSPCPAGTFSLNGTSLISCTPCAPGFSQDNGAATECSPCSSGRFASLAGQASCSPCGPGSVAPSEGSKECTVCREGTYAAPGAAAFNCTQCEVGKASEVGYGSGGCLSVYYEFWCL